VLQGRIVVLLVLTVSTFPARAPMLSLLGPFKTHKSLDKTDPEGYCDCNGQICYVSFSCEPQTGVDVKTDRPSVS
jgi:hypothetical protein